MLRATDAASFVARTPKRATLPTNLDTIWQELSKRRPAVGAMARSGDRAITYCARFLTYSVVEWLPIFVSETACKIVTDGLCFCHANKHLRINAFVIMPTHLHLIAIDAAHDSRRLEKTLADFRKFTGR